MTSESTQFDLDYRPTSYWGSLEEAAEILARIPGTKRRRIARRILDAEGVAGLKGWIAKEQLTETERRAWGRIHPALMGGEYLPSIDTTEIEIARVAMQSTTGDVISIRARHDQGVIHYSIVDEYETEFEPPIKRSTQPLSTRELVDLIDHSVRADGSADEVGLVFPILEMNYAYDDKPETLGTFISVSSDYYPGLGAFYHARIDEWLGAKQIDAHELEYDAFIAQFTAPELGLLEADHGGLKAVNFVELLAELKNHHEVKLDEVVQRFGRPDRPGYLSRVLEAVKREEEEQARLRSVERERERRARELAERERYAAAPIKSPDDFPPDMTVDQLSDAERLSLTKWLRESAGFEHAEIHYRQPAKYGHRLPWFEFWTRWRDGERDQNEWASRPFPTVRAYFASVVRRKREQ